MVQTTDWKAIHMQVSCTLTHSQRLDVWGDAYRQIMVAWHLFKNDRLCRVVSPVSAELRRYDNTIAGYKDLSSVSEWIKHYCQRKTGKLPLDYSRTAVPTVRGRFGKFYLVVHLRLACSI